MNLYYVTTGYTICFTEVYAVLLLPYISLAKLTLGFQFTVGVMGVPRAT